ncbi:MAG: phosphotransferase [Acidobacteria bacterium]|nr:phosphotransferase [Acidobacteriota bacterium]
MTVAATFQVPLCDPLVGEEYPTALASRIASRFDAPRPLEAFDFPDKGNINQHTFLIVGGRQPCTREYLLQRINQQVFTRPETVMSAMVACLETQRRSLARGVLPAGREWDTIQLVSTLDGKPYLEFENLRGKTHWRLMVKIPECRTYKSLSEVSSREEQLLLAEEAGRGLAIYGDLTADMDISGLVSPLPGYRDTRVYFAQLQSVLQGNRTLNQAEPLLPRDPVVRQSTEQHFLVHIPPEEHRRRVEDPDLRHFIELARNEEIFGTTLLKEMEAARIRTVAIHGDTKLDNFLFSQQTGKVKALVDLDTIMPHTWLADWGDMARSLANVAGEKERNLARVLVDMGIYEAIARGFLSTARKITGAEVALMTEAVEIIALELGIRFMTDYLRGNSYFKLAPTDPPDLNKVRGMVQLTLFERLRDNAAEARRCIARFSPFGCTAR